MALVNLPRVSLGLFPTPLQELPNLSQVLGGPRIWAKREDLNGLGGGGNKTRNLEYILADVQKKGTDFVLSSLGSQSNFNILLASAAHKLGMNAGFVCYVGEHPQLQGNLLLHKILNSKIKILKGDRTSGEYVERVGRELQRMSDELSRAGHKPAIVVDGDPHYDVLGVIGWVSGAEELLQQLQTKKINAHYLVVPVATTNTLAGMTLGLKLLKSTIKIIGISAHRKKDEAVAQLVHRANAAATFMGWNIRVVNDDATIYDDYIGTKHEVATKECLEAIQLVAQTEGFYLDPVYTGKSMAGLIDLIRKSKFRQEENVIYVHTGGFPSIFTYNQEIIDYCETKN